MPGKMEKSKNGIFIQYTLKIQTGILQAEKWIAILSISRQEDKLNQVSTHPAPLIAKKVNKEKN